MTLSEMLGVDVPLIQAPMAGVQTGALAAAVSQAGALGSLPCALLTADGVRAELRAIGEKTDGPLNLNFFCHPDPVPDPARERAWREALLPYYRELEIDPAGSASGPGRGTFDAAMCEIVESARPRIVSFHFGLPEPALLARVRASGARILSSATTVDEARWLEAHGVDAIIAQGAEAGGHRGMFLTDDLTTQAGSMALLPQIVNAVSVPVIAAGGIADARGVAAAMKLGASGVQVGTAYLLCPEATTGTLHRAALRSEAAR